MAYNYEYPYTDTSRTNADWLINKMRDLENAIIGIEDDIFAKSKIYIDEQLAPYQEQINQLRAEMRSFTAAIESGMLNFENEIRAQINIFDGRITLIRAELENEIIGVNARTDIAIAQNNEYIFEEISKGFGELRVTNFFTGERTSIQEMLDYLAALHVTDGLTYNQIPSRHNTVAQIVALNQTVTNLVLHANTLITQQ